MGLNTLTAVRGEMDMTDRRPCTQIRVIGAGLGRRGHAADRASGHEDRCVDDVRAVGSALVARADGPGVPVWPLAVGCGAGVGDVQLGERSSLASTCLGAGRWRLRAGGDEGVRSLETFDLVRRVIATASAP